MDLKEQIIKEYLEQGSGFGRTNIKFPTFAKPCSLDKICNAQKPTLQKSCNHQHTGTSRSMRQLTITSYKFV